MKSTVKRVTGKNDQLAVDLGFGSARARVYFQGAHITSWKPDGNTEVLWLSDNANFSPGKAIRGGIPICWPWFGGYWGEGNLSQHGFARTAEFELIDYEKTEFFARARLRMVSDSPYPEWQNCLALEVEICLSESLQVELITTNISDKTIEVGAALHTYYQVNEVTLVEIPELKGLRFKDKVQGFKIFSQDKKFSVYRETDRVFLNPPNTVHLIEPKINRTLAIESWGNTDLVVWNPWAENAKNMADFDDHGYRNMICVEPANALDNRVFLRPEASFRLGNKISVNP